MKMQNKTFTDYELDNIDMRDYPDFVDAFICNASVIEHGTTREATDEELDELNNDGQLVHELVFKQLF